MKEWPISTPIGFVYSACPSNSKSALFFLLRVSVSSFSKAERRMYPKTRRGETAKISWKINWYSEICQNQLVLIGTCNGTSNFSQIYTPLPQWSHSPKEFPLLSYHLPFSFFLQLFRLEFLNQLLNGLCAVASHPQSLTFPWSAVVRWYVSLSE